jgi:hypothetical protein
MVFREFEVYMDEVKGIPGALNLNKKEVMYLHSSSLSVCRITFLFLFRMEDNATFQRIHGRL